VEFTNEPELVARGDSHLLKVVLRALLENAWKFTAKQPAPRVGFGCRHEPEGPVYFVRDNGVGFNMAHANMLFGAFQSVHRKGEFEGLGIGLAMVERIIHRHGGRIWAEGAEGQGACFFFTVGNEPPPVEAGWVYQEAA
jgi:light-regulated signal transduction histidine kinase (bacteriophytochrome)